MSLRMFGAIVVLFGLPHLMAMGQSFTVQQFVPDGFATISVGGTPISMTPTLPTAFGSSVAFVGNGFDAATDQDTFGVFVHNGTGVTSLFDANDPVFTSRNTSGIRRILSTQVGTERVLTVSAFDASGTSQLFRYSATTGLTFVTDTNLGLVGAAVTQPSGATLYEASPPFGATRTIRQFDGGSTNVVVGTGAPIPGRPGQSFTATGFQSLTTNIDFGDDATAVFRGTGPSNLFGLYQVDESGVSELLASDQSIPGLGAPLLDFLGPDVLDDRVGFGSGYFDTAGALRLGFFETNDLGVVSTLLDDATPLPGPTTADDQVLDLFSLTLGDNSLMFSTFDDVDSLQDGWYGQVNGELSRVFGVGDMLDGDAVLIAANPIYVGDERYVIPVRFDNRFALYQVTATAIPEPSLLASLALTGMVLVYRRRSQHRISNDR